MSVSPGMPCMWCTMGSRCHGWCSVTSGRVLTWWTVSSHVPLRKPSSLFSWPPPLPSAWSSTWLNLPISLPRPSLGRSINQTVRWLINWLIYWSFSQSTFLSVLKLLYSTWLSSAHKRLLRLVKIWHPCPCIASSFPGVSLVRRRGSHAADPAEGGCRIRQARSYLSQPEEAATKWMIHAGERHSRDLKHFKAA